jgi:uncharacterized Zn ribbon protein
MQHELEFLKQKVLYTDALVKQECPYCKKGYLIENETKYIICERCKRKIKFWKLSIPEQNSEWFKNTVMKCDDSLTHIRSIKLIKKLKFMNEKERADFFNDPLELLAD